MAQTPGQQTAADAVAAEMADRGWSNADLATATADEAAGLQPLDLGTIGDFLNYERWPKLGTQGRIERAFGWPAGTIRLISLGKAERPVETEEAIPEPDLTASAKDPLDIPDLSEAMTEFMRQHSYRHGPRDVGPDA